MNVERNSIDLDISISEQVSRDIDTYLARFKDPKKGLNMLATKSQIHVKTLNRLREKIHTPVYSTLYKLYACLLDSRIINDLIEKAPPVISERLKSADPQLKSSPLNKFHFDIENDMQKNPCFSELYVLAETRPFSTSYVEQRFGSYGMEILKKMIEQKVIRSLGNGLFGQGEVRSTFSGDTIKSVGVRLTERFLKPGNADLYYGNYMSIYFESVSEETYKEWLKIEEQAFKDRIKLLENPEAKGSIPVFAFSAIDTLTENDQ